MKLYWMYFTRIQLNVLTVCLIFFLSSSKCFIEIAIKKYVIAFKQTDCVPPIKAADSLLQDELEPMIILFNGGELKSNRSDVFLFNPSIVYHCSFCLLLPSCSFMLLCSAKHKHPTLLLLTFPVCNNLKLQ